jgi:hypothetical protein
MKQAKESIRSVSKELDVLYGKEGSPEREAFRKEARTYYKGIAEQEAKLAGQQKVSLATTV